VKLIVERTEKLSGSVLAPPSKSHTHRALILASLAAGTSTIENHLTSDDIRATIEACRKLGAKIETGQILTVTGVDGKPQTPSSEIDVRNSGTTIRLLTAVATLCDGTTKITGDASIRSRPIGPLLKSLTDLGAKGAVSVKGNGCPPVSITGKMTGGKTNIDAESSQFLSALLLSCPLAEKDCDISVKDLNSRPYVKMTLEHLERAGAKVRNEEMRTFHIPGGQSYKPFRYKVPGDFSSAAFLIAAAKITGSTIKVFGLDQNDTQGDKAILTILQQMRSGDKREIDLRDTPDLLPISAVLGCYSEGTTVLKNVPHARLKESDRISSICMELKKMGANIKETADGLIVSHSPLKGATLDGHKDHRVVMALTVAALSAEGKSIINDADTLSTSYPQFVADLVGLGANIKVVGKSTTRE
jgi:3-phosphoshikimate 1-carboxyvinyltransferase